MNMKMINYLLMTIRKKCVICGGELDHLFTLNMPPFMGVSSEVKLIDLNKMIFTKCVDCDTVQLEELLPPEIVYQGNHNIGIVGKTWEEHYNELVDFIKPHITDKRILEISDPSAKIAKRLSDESDKWYIVEPNPDIESFGNVTFINEFFDSNFNMDDKIDIIVNSHFFEHTYDPNQFLVDCFNLLDDGGSMIISIPNLEFLLNDKVSPNGILHFEHTFYYDLSRLETIFKNNGFYIERIQEYKKHSLFIQLIKDSKSSNYKELSDDVSNKFINNLNYHKKQINKINDTIIDKDNVYLYGSHVTSQFYIFNGLNTINIKGVLDNSKSKQGKFLFGTDLKVLDPNTIDISEEIIILCSHMGIYFEEIKNQLNNLSDNIVII